MAGLTGGMMAGELLWFSKAQIPLARPDQTRLVCGGSADPGSKTGLRQVLDRSGLVWSGLLAASQQTKSGRRPGLFNLDMLRFCLRQSLVWSGLVWSC